MALPAFPRIEAEGLILRAFEPGDVSWFKAVAVDPAIPWITAAKDQPTDAEALAFIDRQHGRFNSDEGYSFAIALAETNEAVGQITLGLWNIRQGRAFIGYSVAARHRGRGIAAQALRAISRWGLRHPGVARLDLCVEPSNEASWRTAEKVGYVREGLLRSWQAIDGERRDMYMYSLLPSDPAAKGLSAATSPEEPASA